MGFSRLCLLFCYPSARSGDWESCSSLDAKKYYHDDIFNSSSAQSDPETRQANANDKEKLLTPTLMMGLPGRRTDTNYYILCIDGRWDVVLVYFFINNNM